MPSSSADVFAGGGACLAQQGDDLFVAAVAYDSAKPLSRSVEQTLLDLNRDIKCGGNLERHIIEPEK